MNELTIEQIEIGVKASFSRTITKEMEDAFRSITGDDNPLHRDDVYAKEISKGKYQRHVAFGLLTASLCSTIAGMYLPGKYSTIHSFDELSFLKPVYVGDELTVKGEVIDKISDLKLIMIKVTIKNQAKQTVVRAKMKVLVLQ